MDVKAPLEKYAEVVRVDFPVGNIVRSIELIRRSGEVYLHGHPARPELQGKGDLLGGRA